MEFPPRPSLRNCPVCRLAMVASKSSADRPHVDTFTCLDCGMIITTAEPKHRPRGQEGA